jgi:hypothetical protein
VELTTESFPAISANSLRANAKEKTGDRRFQEFFDAEDFNLIPSWSNVM